MFSVPEFTENLFNPNVNFDDLAYLLFNYQYKNNILYRDYIHAIGLKASKISKPEEIPFLPIGFFKTHEVKTDSFVPELVFESSGTTQSVNSKHLVKEAKLYEQSFLKTFEMFYGKVSEYVIIGLLPSYLERKNSSLVYMVRELIKLSGQAESGFYLYEHEKLASLLQKLENEEKKVLLIGVTFGLLDFAEKYPMQLKNTMVMETGGMKGRREEWTRQQVHLFLKEKLGLNKVHSEYGMTELLSQAYSSGSGIFRCPPWMKIVLRDMNDPLQILPPPGKDAPTQGIINVIDLANIHSCAFIATDDLGRLYADGSFEVLGRRDSSDLRGCSLMTS